MGDTLSQDMVDELEDIEDEEQEPTVPASTKNYMTPRGYQRLHDELKNLIEKERPETVKVVSWAASNGDRSENGDYIYGKKRLRELDKRIRFLNRRLAYAEIIDPGTQENVDRIYFGATVTLVDPADREYRYRIVGIDEADPELGDISWISPLARALLKREIGDLVSVCVCGEKTQYEIVDIEYLPCQ